MQRYFRSPQSFLETAQAVLRRFLARQQQFGLERGHPGRSTLTSAARSTWSSVFEIPSVLRPGRPRAEVKSVFSVLTVAALFCLSLKLHPMRLFAAQPETADIVIYGATSAGVAAAVQASRMGLTVFVIEPGRHVGGLTSSGLGWTDSGNKAVVGGVSREFYQRIKKHYDAPSAWRFENRNEYSRYRPEEDAMWTFEPHVAEDVFLEMLAEAKVPVVFNQRLNRSAGEGVRLDGKRLAMIVMESGAAYAGKMFIDATYEGDLMAAAGVSYTVGREANSRYGETIDGVQKARNIWNHRFVKAVDPYSRAGDPSSGLLFGIDPGPYPEDGSGDHRLQAYCYRMAMSLVPENRVPFPKPADYDESKYELLLRNFEAGDLRFPMKPDMMPNGKTDTNNNGAFSTDFIGQNYDYPEANYEQRARILAEHESYQKGFMWTLANHPRVPGKVRTEMKNWGLAADEFTDNGNWPHQIYVREARRMVSDYVMTELDCRRQRLTPESVGMGSYNMDSHNCMRWVTPDGKVQNEGDIQISPGGSYQISYQSLVPKRGEAANLLVPVCLSSSHIAYGSIRMEPVFMVLGQSAATAAALAIENRKDVQDIDYAKLEARLLSDKQVLEAQDRGRSRAGLDPDRLPGMVVDDIRAERINTWIESSSVPGFVGEHYLHDDNQSKGAREVRFEVPLQDPGEYEVRISYTANPNRASNVPAILESARGTVTQRVNQKQNPPIDGVWISLGVHRFESGKARLTISNEGTDGYVIADAIQFLPQNADARSSVAAFVGPERWAETMLRFTEGDAINPPPKGGVLFVGSSSIRLWNLAESFPGLPVINRGFGGSQVEDSVYYVESLVLKHEPRIVVLYAGDNDIAAKKSPSDVFDDFRVFVRKIHERIPRTKIVFVAIKPSLKRWELIDKIREANDRILRFTAADARLEFVDVDKPMLGLDQKPRPELFRDDGLHLNAEGYALWTKLVSPYLSLGAPQSVALPWLRVAD